MNVVLRLNLRRRMPLALVVALAASTLGSSLAVATPQHSAPTSGTLGGFARTWGSVSQYTATVTLFERQGTRVQRAVYDYTFRKPSSVTLHVSSGASAGDTLVWDGGTTVVAHRGSGLFSAIKKKFGLHDPATTTIRGSSVDQLSFGEILAHARETPGKLESRAGGKVNGEATQALALIPRSASLDGGLTREIVLLSKTTFLPVRVLGYAGNALVREINFSNVQLKRNA